MPLQHSPLSFYSCTLWYDSFKETTHRGFNPPDLWDDFTNSKKKTRGAASELMRESGPQTKRDRTFSVRTP